jgi:hypothetical protein
VIYALNVYDLIPDKEAIYARYLAQASAAIANLDVTVIAAGEKPIRSLCGQSRNHFIVAQFADEATFDALIAALEERDLHRLREEATENYIWTLYEPWPIGQQGTPE